MVEFINIQKNKIMIFAKTLMKKIIPPKDKVCTYQHKILIHKQGDCCLYQKVIQMSSFIYKKHQMLDACYEERISLMMPYKTCNLLKSYLLPISSLLRGLLSYLINSQKLLKGI